jgi:hypothetical protein
MGCKSRSDRIPRLPPLRPRELLRDGRSSGKARRRRSRTRNRGPRAAAPRAAPEGRPRPSGPARGLDPAREPLRPGPPRTAPCSAREQPPPPATSSHEKATGGRGERSQTATTVCAPMSPPLRAERRAPLPPAAAVAAASPLPRGGEWNRRRIASEVLGVRPLDSRGTGGAKSPESPAAAPSPSLPLVLVPRASCATGDARDAGRRSPYFRRARGRTPREPSGPEPLFPRRDRRLRERAERVATARGGREGKGRRCRSARRWVGRRRARSRRPTRAKKHAGRTGQGRSLPVAGTSERAPAGARVGDDGLRRPNDERPRRKVMDSESGRTARWALTVTWKDGRRDAWRADGPRILSQSCEK